MGLVDKRDHYLDNAKFFLIAMVIFSHCLSNLGAGRLCKSVDSYMYFLHMPLFIIISGYFTKLQDGAKVRKSILKLLETLLIFNVLHIVIRYFAGNLKGDIVSILLEPQWSLWYILSLIWWKLISYTAIRVVKLSPGTFFLISILLGLIAGFVPLDRQLSFQRTFFFLPFFSFGYLVREKLDIRTIRKVPIVFCIAFLVLLLTVTILYGTGFKRYLMGCFQYHVFDYSTVVSVGIRICSWLLCFLAALCFLRCMPTGEVKFVSREGANTLYYYLYHTIVIYVFIALCKYFNLSTSFVAVIGYSILVFLVCMLLQRFKIFRTLPNFVSSSVERFKKADK